MARFYDHTSETTSKVKTLRGLIKYLLKEKLECQCNELSNLYLCRRCRLERDLKITKVRDLVGFAQYGGSNFSYSIQRCNKYDTDEDGEPYIGDFCDVCGEPLHGKEPHEHYGLRTCDMCHGTIIRHG